MEELAVKLSKVSKTYTVTDSNSASIRDAVFNLFKSRKRRKIKAIQSLDLEIKKGEVFGIIGRNGSGKSTLLKIIMNSIRPDKGGTVTTNGKMIKLSLSLGFDPLLTARENIYINGSVLGLSMKEIGKKFDEIIKFAELENFVDTNVKYFSSGMKARLGFAVAIHADADIFLFDEFFGGVGDIRFKKRSQKAFTSAFMKDKTIIIVSHGMNTIEDNCERTLLLDRGEVIGIGPTSEMIETYTKLVMSEEGKHHAGAK